MSLFDEKISRLKKLVGNTPVLRLLCEVDGKEITILAKYEAWNFTGSIKDRMAYQILSSSYTNGVLTENQTIIEATSGNTGIAFAAMGAYLGMPVYIYMPSWLSEERKRLLEFYGAKLIQYSAEEGGFLRCIEEADKKSRKKGYFCPQQFKNSWNVLAHYQNTAPELHEAMKSHNLGDLDIFIAGIGTGGTVMGFYRYFSNLNDNFKAIPVLPDKNKDGEHRIEGIGDSFVPEILAPEELEPFYRVRDSDAISVARQINKLGLSVGISSGANIFSAAMAKINNPGAKNIATVLCDCNKKYLTTDLCSDSQENLSQNIKILEYERLT